MFSGIVEATATIFSTQLIGTCLRVSIKRPSGWRLKEGESISVDGICSTVVSYSSKSFEVEYMPATLSKTTAGRFSPKRKVNLERSLMWRGRIHGHFVGGHVDAPGQLVGIQKKGRSQQVTVSIPRVLSSLVVPRGSVAINGVSLTVVDSRKGALQVALIPHTLRTTNLGEARVGDTVNVECDMLARYARKPRNATVRSYAKKRAQSD